MAAKRFIIDEYLGIGSVVIDTENENVRFKHENKLSMKQCCDLLNSLNDKNEQLKQRNDRQAKRLAELYELMAKKDWESLTEIIDDFCSCEEQLQREWRNLNIQVGLDND